MQCASRHWVCIKWTTCVISRCLHYSMHNYKSFKQTLIITNYVLFISISWNTSTSCQAQLSSGRRFLINFFADVSEILQRFPQNSLKRVVTPVVTRTQNELVSNPNFNFFTFLGGSQQSTLLSNKPSDVHFLVFNNRRKPNSFFHLDLDSTITDLKYVRPPSGVKILIHGYNSEDTDRFPRATKDAYLFTTDYPVIWVDWRELATPKIFTPSILYPAIADNVPIVGLRVFHLIEFLLRSGIVRSLQDIHLIGHSLGAHICGRAGQLMFMRHGVKVGRITGLDPAGPLFRSLGHNFVLDASDADFVDIIHSSFTGISTPVAHADFYPNGGQFHPHCLNLPLDNIIACNHNAAFEYFTRSLFDRNMIACGCKSYQTFRQSCGKYCYEKAILGEVVSHRARGKFFLDYDLDEL